MNSTRDDPQPPRRKSRWYQFTLRTLLLLTALAALWLGFQLHRAERNRRTVTFVRKMGGQVWTSRQHDNSTPLVGRVGRVYRQAVRAMFGEEAVRDVVAVDLGGTRVADADLSKLRKLKQLQWLGLADTEVTDEGLAYLEGLTRLQWLDVSYTRISADGLSRLSGLKGLRWLDAHGTNVGKRHVDTLQRVWPRAQVAVSREPVDGAVRRTGESERPKQPGALPPPSVWKAFKQAPYAKQAFSALMRAIGRDPTKEFSAWYISGVFRAKRKGREPLWVVQVYDGTPGDSFNLGCLIVLGPDGKHLRTITGERIHWSLSAPKSEFEPLWSQLDKGRVAELPDFTGDGNAEIPTQYWRPCEGTAIYLADEESIPCVFRIDINDFSGPHFDGLADLCNVGLHLQFRDAGDGVLYLVTPIYRPTVVTGAGRPGSFRLDRTEPARTLTRFKWSEKDKTFVGPAKGPNGLWKVHDR